MFDKEKYGKILTPLVTPFKEGDQSVDYAAAVSIAEKLIEDNMADSIILTGTTGEFFTMSFEERVKLFKIIKDAVGNKIPLMAGVGCSSTIETVALAKKAQELGFEIMMVVSPYYTKPTQKELYNHFKKVAESVNIQMMLYNIPIFTGVNINPETVAKLSEIENIIAIKEEAELNPKQVTEFINATPDDFIIYCGDDPMILEALLFRIMGQNGRTNPASLIKEAMKMVGYNAGIPRLPLTPGTEEEIAEVRKVMKKIKII